MIYIGNAFSLGMLERDSVVEVKSSTIEEVKEVLKENFISAVGHETTAKIISELVGMQVSTNRINLKLQEKDILVVFQLMTRLPEGVILNTEEILTFPHKWYIVTIK